MATRSQDQEGDELIECHGGGDEGSIAGTDSKIKRTDPPVVVCTDTDKSAVTEPFSPTINHASTYGVETFESYLWKIRAKRRRLIGKKVGGEEGVKLPPVSEGLRKNRRPIIEWDELEESQTPLYKSLADPVNSSLVGWANHQTSDRIVNTGRVDPLSNMPNQPLPSSYLKFLHENGKVGSNKKPSKPLEVDVSGRVALGFVVENILTAALVPLARRHVKRCRSVPPKQEAFGEWTIPPEEAVLKLSGHGGCVGEAEIKSWCNSRGFDEHHVRTNRDLYCMIIGRARTTNSGARTASFESNGLGSV